MCFSDIQVISTVEVPVNHQPSPTACNTAVAAAAEWTRYNLTDSQQYLGSGWSSIQKSLCTVWYSDLR
jgi:hypothetical protein